MEKQLEWLFGRSAGLRNVVELPHHRQWSFRYVILQDKHDTPKRDSEEDSDSWVFSWQRSCRYEYLEGYAGHHHPED
jgi:hypothetical protein